MYNQTKEKKQHAQQLLTLLRKGSLEQIQEKVHEIQGRGWDFECTLLGCSLTSNNQLFIVSHRDKKIPMKVMVGEFPW